MHRGREALQMANEARCARDLRLHRARIWRLLAIARYGRARRLCDQFGEEATHLYQLAHDARERYWRQMHKMGESDELIIAWEIKARIAFEDAEERYAGAPDEEWDWLARHRFTTTDLK